MAEADRELEQHRVLGQLLAQLVTHAVGIGAFAIALVDEGNARNAIAVHLPVDGERLALHAGHRAQHQHGAVEHAQAALHLDGEVDVAWGVDDVDVMAVPLAVSSGAGDGDAALALELHRVHLGADTVLAAHVVNGVHAVGVEEDALGQRGLAAVDVRGDTDVF